MEKGDRFIMEDLIKDLVDKLLRANCETYEIKEEGYRNQIKALHDRELKQQNIIQEQRKVILEFRDEIRELRKGIKEDGKTVR